MKHRLLTGLPILILGLIIAIGPLTFFHVCTPENHDMIMTCGYMARTELGIGISIAVIALISVFVKSDKTQTGYFVSAAVLSILAMSVPAFLIGVCEGAHMHCRTTALPSLVNFSIILFIASVVFAILSYKKGNKNDA